MEHFIFMILVQVSLMRGSCGIFAQDDGMRTHSIRLIVGGGSLVFFCNSKGAFTVELLRERS